MTHFSSMNNKKLLWKVLQQNGTFKNIPEKKYSEIIAIFEAKIGENDIVQGLSLVDLNKKFIVEMSATIKQFTLKDNETMRDIIKQRDDGIRDIIRPSPPEINFANEIDEVPSQDDIDRMLRDTISRRDYDISTIVHKQSDKSVTFDDNESKLVSDDTITKRLDIIETKINEILSIVNK
jgi:hypothetical protein